MLLLLLLLLYIYIFYFFSFPILAFIFFLHQFHTITRPHFPLLFSLAFSSFLIFLFFLFFFHSSSLHHSFTCGNTATTSQVHLSFSSFSPFPHLPYSSYFSIFCYSSFSFILFFFPKNPSILTTASRTIDQTLPVSHCRLTTPFPSHFLTLPIFPFYYSFYFIFSFSFFFFLLLTPLPANHHRRSILATHRFFKKTSVSPFMHFFYIYFIFFLIIITIIFLYLILIIIVVCEIWIAELIWNLGFVN